MILKWTRDSKNEHPQDNLSKDRLYCVWANYNGHSITIYPKYPHKYSSVPSFYIACVDSEEINETFDALRDAKEYCVDALECVLAKEGKINNIKSFKDINGNIGKIGSKIKPIGFNGIYEVIALHKQGRAGVKLFYVNSEGEVNSELGMYVKIIE